MFECKRCGFVTRRRDDWGEHLNTHATDQLRMLEKEAAEAAAAVPSSAASSSSSTPSKPKPDAFQCPECDFSCRRRDMYG